MWSIFNFGTSEERIRRTTPPPLQKSVCLKTFNEEDIKKKMANYVKKNENGLTWGLETPLPHTTKCLLHYVIGHIFCENLLNNHIEANIFLHHRRGTPARPLLELFAKFIHMLSEIN